MEKEKKVVLRLSHVGDIVLITGVLEYRAKHFNEEFIVITKKGMAVFFQNNPTIIQCIELDTQDLKLKNFIHKAQELAKTFPFTLYDLHHNTRSRILKFFWKKKTFTYEKLGLARRLFLWSKGKIRFSALDTHITQRYYKAFEDKTLSTEELLPKIYLDSTELEKMKENLLKNFKEEDFSRIIALHPFATHEPKEWPEGNWKNLYTNLIKENYIPLFIGKGKNFDWIKKEHNYINSLSLRESCALLHFSNCLVSGDSGPVHMANAVNCSVLALFGATVKEWGFFPQYGKSKVIEKSMACKPCSLHGKNNNCQLMHTCMKSIQEEYIIHVLNSHFFGII